MWKDGEKKRVVFCVWFGLLGWLHVENAYRRIVCAYPNPPYFRLLYETRPKSTLAVASVGGGCEDLVKLSLL